MFSIATLWYGNFFGEKEAVEDQAVQNSLVAAAKKKEIFGGKLQGTSRVDQDGRGGR